METPAPILVDDNKICVVALVESAEACVDQNPPNMTEILNDNASTSSADKGPETNTNGHSDACESLVFEQFINACTPHLKIPGDEPIMAKLRRHYGKIDPVYRKTRKFYSEMSRFILQVQNSDIYVIIQEVLIYFKSCNAKSSSKKQAHIKKLESYLEKLDEKIKELQAQEVDFDDEENSNYIAECRYKKRFAYVYGKLCDIVGYSKNDPKPKIEYNGTRFPEINRNITRYLKKNDAFPDFKDVLEIITETNEQAGLLMSEEHISRMTREVFEEVGSKLKKRRIEDFEATFGCSLTDHLEIDDSNDPASHDTELREKLTNNQQIATKRLDEVMESYVLKQESRGEEKDKGSNEEEDDEEDEEDDEDDEEDEEDDEDDEEDDVDEEEEMEDLDNDNFLVEIKNVKSSELPSGTEDSEIDQHTYPLTKSTKIPPSELEVIQKVESSEPSKNGFLAELDVKPNIKPLTTAPKSPLPSPTVAISNRESLCTNLNNRNPSRAVKRDSSYVDNDVAVKQSAKRKVPIQRYIDDDDVIVLSD